MAAIDALPALSLDELVALNDEIAALVRAGAPLDQGLRALGADLPGRLGRAATAMGSQLAAGATLEQLVERAGIALPPVYRAVLVAGLRTGRPAAALEDVSRSARQQAQLRRRIGVAWIYPLAVVFIAFTLFAFTVHKLSPVMLQAYEAFDLAPDAWIRLLAWLGHTRDAWLPLVVPLGLAAFAAGWWWSGRAARLGRGPSLLFPLANLRRKSRLATFTELTALLLEHRVPLEEALPLAGEAAGGELAAAARQLADSSRQGAAAPRVPAPVPALLGWLLTAREAAGDLPRGLRQLAQSYRDESERIAWWWSAYAPTLLTVTVAGSAVVVYLAATVAPWLRVLTQLTRI